MRQSVRARSPEPKLAPAAHQRPVGRRRRRDERGKEEIASGRRRAEGGADLEASRGVDRLR
jgi:hypothetical protein